MYRALDAKQKKHDAGKAMVNQLSTLVSADAIDDDKAARDKAANNFIDQSSMMIYGAGGDYSVIGGDIEHLLKEAYKSRTIGELAAYQGTYDQFKKLRTDLAASKHSKSSQDAYLQNQYLAHKLNGGTRKGEDGSWHSYNGAQVPEWIDVADLMTDYVNKLKQADSVEFEKQYGNIGTPMARMNNELGMLEVYDAGTVTDSKKVLRQDKLLMLMEGFFQANPKAREQFEFETKPKIQNGFYAGILNSPDGKLIADRDMKVIGTKIVPLVDKDDPSNSNGQITLKEDEGATVVIRKGEEITPEMMDKISSGQVNNAINSFMYKSALGGSYSEIKHNIDPNTQYIKWSYGEGGGEGGGLSSLTTGGGITEFDSQSVTTETYGKNLGDFADKNEQNRAAYNNDATLFAAAGVHIPYDKLNQSTFEDAKSRIEKSKHTPETKRQMIEKLEGYMSYIAGRDHIIDKILNNIGNKIELNPIIDGNTNERTEVEITKDQFKKITEGGLVTLNNGLYVKKDENGNFAYYKRGTNKKPYLLNNEGISPMSILKNNASSVFGNSKEFEKATAGAVTLKASPAANYYAANAGLKLTTGQKKELQNDMNQLVASAAVKSGTIISGEGDAPGLEGEWAGKPLDFIAQKGGTYEIDGDAFRGTNNNNYFQKYKVKFGKEETSIVVKVPSDKITFYGKLAKADSQISNMSSAQFEAEKNISLYKPDDYNFVNIDGTLHTMNEAFQSYTKFNLMKAHSGGKISQEFMRDAENTLFNGYGTLINKTYDPFIFNSISHADSSVGFSAYKKANGFSVAAKTIEDAKDLIDNNDVPDEVMNVFKALTNKGESDKAIHFINQYVNASKSYSLNKTF
jgi:hypothetical protein